MKIVIMSEGVKREISGAFDVCMSRADMEALCQQLDVQLKKEDWTLGWLTIWPRPVRDINGTPPLNWKASAREYESACDSELEREKE